MISINSEFNKWVERTKKYYEYRGIKLDYLEFNNIEIEITDNPATRADYLTEKYIGSVIVWKSGFMDIQVMDIETQEIILYEHFYNILNDKFKKYLKKFFEVLCS